MEIADVVTLEEITIEWGNAIRDRTVQRYTDLTERTTLSPTPTAGDLSILEDTGDLDYYFGGAWKHLNGPPVGTIIDHAGGSVPSGWLACDGSAISRTVYAALFSQIGTAWGVGDGSTTFNIPDLRGRVTRGVAVTGEGDAVGEVFGADTHLHTGPSHTHTGPNHTHTGPSHTHSTPNHAHTNPSTGAAGSHSHGGFTGLATVGGVASGSGFIFTPDHEHTIVSDGNHGHSMGNTGTGGGGTSGAAGTGATGAAGTGATGASGTANTGSSSTIQASAAVNKLIRT